MLPSSAGPTRQSCQGMPFSTCQESTSRHGHTHHGHVACVAAAKAFGFALAQETDKLSHLAGIGAMVTDFSKVKVKKYSPFKSTTGQEHYYWPVKAWGFGKDNCTPPKRTIDMQINCYSEQMADLCVTIWQRVINKNWKTMDYRDIRNMVRQELYPAEIEEQLAGGDRFNFRNHDIQNHLQTTQHCTLFPGVCSMLHICRKCKVRNRSCKDLGIESQCFPCSVRSWGNIWRSTKLNSTIQMLHKKDGKEGLTIEQAQWLPSGCLPMSAARYN